MKEGDVVLASLRQATGAAPRKPVSWAGADFKVCGEHLCANWKADNSMSPPPV
jgi:hypothetical protein